MAHIVPLAGSFPRFAANCGARPGRCRARTAASHLSRSVFYQRIALIEELLGFDLDDGETIGALHAAVLARPA
ncbi:helix-turn-helix domain-containing protein [Leifsonia sp. NPDC080035]|uniref:Helix-turn-helix domain-containing protein n=1 Tax=Leifsonia sp. NPDC080035 TaxID=3143936 RepID=A0AAU7GC61_9MICO